MKCGNNNLSSVRGLVSQLVGYECGISRSFMFDGLFVSVYSNSCEFFYAVVHTEDNKFASVVVQLSFFPTERRLCLGYCMDKDCRSVVKEAFADCVPDIAISDSYEVLVKYAALHQLAERMEESCPCFFTDSRISHTDVPCGVFLYDVRSDVMDGVSPASIERSVAVNYYGTIAVSVPLPVPIALSVPYIPYNEDGDIDSDHRVKGTPTQLGALAIGDKFYPDRVPESAETGVESIVDAPIYPNMIVASIEPDRVLATDGFGGIHSFDSNQRVWVIPEVLSAVS